MPNKEATVVIEPLIEYVAKGMAFRKRKFALKREVSIILYGPLVNEEGTHDDKPAKMIDGHAYENIRKKARELLRERASISQDDAKLDSIGLYEEIIKDDDVPPLTRIKAQIQLDMIHRVNEASQAGGVEQTAAAAIAALAALGNVMQKGPDDDDVPAS